MPGMRKVWQETHNQPKLALHADWSWSLLKGLHGLEPKQGSSSGLQREEEEEEECQETGGECAKHHLLNVFLEYEKTKQGDMQYE